MARKLMVLAELKDAQCKQSLTQLLHMIRMDMMESMNIILVRVKLIIVGIGHHHDHDHHDDDVQAPVRGEGRALW